MPAVKPVYPVLQQSHPLTMGLRSCWLMGGMAGPVVRDLTGYANHGTLSDTAYLSWGPSEYGMALRHSRETGTFITVPDNDSLDITGQFTLIALVNYEVDTFNWLGMITKVGAATNLTPYELYRDRNTDRLGLRVMSQAMVCPTTVIGIGRWYHCAVTFNISKIATFYVDGTAAGTTGPYSVFPSTSALQLNIGNAWQGAIAGAWIYDRALTPDEIALHAFDPFAMARPRQRIWKSADIFLKQRQFNHGVNNGFNSGWN